MKSLLIAIFIMFLLPNSILSKQNNMNIDLDDFIQTLLMEKRIKFKNNIKLEDAQKIEFWPIYDKFEEEMKTILREIVSSTDKLVFETEPLNEKQIETLIDSVIEKQKVSIDIQGKYFKKFAKILSQDQMSIFARTLFLQ